MEEKYNSSLKNDIPITKFNDDKLDRKKFAIQMREIIKKYNSKECLTIGIMGSWGSGKTSLINMIVDQKNENILTRKHFKVMRFNPWNFSKQQDLYFQFFEQLKEIIISNENDESKRKHIKNVINNYWEKVRYDGSLSLSLKGFITFTKPLGEKTIENSKKDLSQILRYLRYKIIIIIDDIDRLTDDEIQQIFILVKALADFPNIIYILSFDRIIIANSIDKLQKGFGEEFLDKIVQLPIDIPKISKIKVKNIFQEELEKFIKNEGIDLDSKRNLGHTTSFLTNIRDVNRYINSLKFYLPIMKGEINPFDFILLTGLQLFENEIYHEIKNSKTFFTKNLITKPDKDSLSISFEIYEKILSNCKRLEKDTLKSILLELFPQLINFEFNWDLSNQVANWNSQLRICSYNIFDRYFELSLDENEMSNILFNVLIQSDDYDFIKKQVLDIDNEGKSNDFLRKLSDNAHKINPKNIKLYFRLLYDIGDNLNVETGGFLFSKINLLLQTIGSLSNRLDNSDLYDAMCYAIKNAQDALYLLVDDLTLHDKINKRYRFKNDEDHGQKQLSDNQLDDLEKEAGIKIKKWQMKVNYLMLICHLK